MNQKKITLQNGSESCEANYHDVGAGPALVLLHNGCTGSFIWRPQIAEFSKTHRVLALDIPGFGDSGRPEGKYSLEILTKWVQLWLAHVSESDPKVIIGNCIGAAIGIELSKKPSNQVKGLILFNVCGGLRAMNRMNRFFYRIRFFRVLALLMRFQNFRRAAWGEMFHNINRVDPKDLQAFTRIILHPLQNKSRNGMLLGLSSFNPVLMRTLKPNPSIPTKVIWGEKNKIVPIRFAQDQIDVVMLDAGHVPMLEFPKETNDEIRKALEEINQVQS